jgi:hypothetical protein
LSQSNRNLRQQQKKVTQKVPKITESHYLRVLAGEAELELASALSPKE